MSDPGTAAPAAPQEDLSAEEMNAAEANAEIERLRRRVHEVADECQRRHARYVSRCVQFELWSRWARDRFEAAGSDYWSMTSQADRLVIMSIIAERDGAVAEAARVRAQVAEEIAGAIEGNVRNEDFSKQDRGGFVGFAPKMAYVAGHDRAAAIAREHAVLPAQPGPPNQEDHRGVGRDR